MAALLLAFLLPLAVPASASTQVSPEVMDALNAAHADFQQGRIMDCYKKLLNAKASAHQKNDFTSETYLLKELGAVATHSPDLGHGVAVKWLKEAEGLAGRSGLRDLQMATLFDISTIDRVMGDFKDGIAAGEAARKLARPGSSNEVAALGGLSAIYDEMGDFDAALPVALEAVEKGRLLPDKHALAAALSELGIVYANLEDPRSVDVLKEALKIRYWGGDDINLGDAYMHLDRFQDALTLYSKVDHKLGYGRAHLLMGNYPQAEEVMDAVIARDEPRREFSGLLAAYTGRGLAFEGQGEPANAARDFKKAGEYVENVREGLGENHRLAFYSGNDWLFVRFEPYEGLVRVSTSLPGGVRESFYYAEYTRGRVFTEAGARRYGQPETRVPAPLAAKESQLDAAVVAARGEYNAAFSRNDPAARKRAETALASAKKALAGFVETLRADYPEYASVRYPLPVHVEDVPLEADEAIIEFEVTDPYTKAFVVKKGTIAYSYDIPRTRKQLTKEVREYLAYFSAVSDTGKLDAYDPAAANKLYKLLLAPALSAKDRDGRPFIGKDSRVIIVPDEILALMPFESLVISSPERGKAPSAKGGAAPLGVQFVGDRYDVAYSQSATALTLQRSLKRHATPAKDLFVLADPVFSAADSRAGGAAVKAPERTKEEGVRTMGVGGLRGGGAGKEFGREDFLFQRLDKTSLLAEALSKKVFPGKTDVMKGASATERNLEAQKIGDYRFLVFATHGILDKTVRDVREPALVLGQLDKDPAHDGFLTVSEVMQTKLTADVVALTACQTGLGKRISGEGVMGLGRAFQYAGAKHVLVSLWSVSEDSTTELAGIFFENLKQGKTPRESLKLARAGIRREGYEHPFYWAPFILVTQ